MSQNYGSEAPRPHSNTHQRQPARYLVVIESGGYMVARLFLEKDRELVAEFDASTEETGHMIQGLAATHDAGDPAWDKALQGHSAEERAAADVYLLPV